MLKQNKQEIYTFLRKDGGLPHKACIGIMANISLVTEGTFDFKHRNKKGQTTGLFNFFEDLKKAYYSFRQYYRNADCNHSQITFMVGTIKGSEAGVGIGAENAKNIKETLQDQSLTSIQQAQRFSTMYLRQKQPNMELLTKAVTQLQKDGLK